MPVKETAAMRCFRQLRAEILNGSIAPGTRLTLRPTAERLGVAHNTVGEALHYLEKEDLVELEPRVGAKVRARDFESLRSDYILRFALETESVRRVAEQRDTLVIRHLETLATTVDSFAGTEEFDRAREADTAFHLALAGASGSRALAGSLKALLPRLIVSDQYSLDRPEAAPSHTAIVEKIAAGDAGEAIARIRLHIEDSMHWATTAEREGRRNGTIQSG